MVWIINSIFTKISYRNSWMFRMSNRNSLGSISRAIFQNKRSAQIGMNSNVFSVCHQTENSTLLVDTSEMFFIIWLKLQIKYYTVMLNMKRASSQFNFINFIKLSKQHRKISNWLFFRVLWISFSVSRRCFLLLTLSISISKMLWQRKHINFGMPRHILHRPILWEYDDQKKPNISSEMEIIGNASSKANGTTFGAVCFESSQKNSKLRLSESHKLYECVWECSSLETRCT